MSLYNKYKVHLKDRSGFLSIVDGSLCITDEKPEGIECVQFSPAIQNDDLKTVRRKGGPFKDLPGSLLRLHGQAATIARHVLFDIGRTGFEEDLYIECPDYPAINGQLDLITFVDSGSHIDLWAAHTEPARRTIRGLS